MATERKTCGNKILSWMKMLLISVVGFSVPLIIIPGIVDNYKPVTMRVFKPPDVVHDISKPVTMRVFKPSDVVHDVSRRHSEDLFKNVNFLSNETSEHVCHPFNSMSSGNYSKIHSLRTDLLRGYVTFTISLYDVRNHPKIYGGDVIFVSAKLVRGTNKGNVATHFVAGEIMDFENGTYSARIKIMWTGNTEITVSIASKYENMCRRFRSMVIHGESTYAMNNPHNIWFTFKKGNIKEDTRCSGSVNVSGYNKTCNFTKANFGMSLYCGRPLDTRLNCSTTNLIPRTGNYPSIQPEVDIVHDQNVEKLRQTLRVNLTFLNSDNNKRLPSCSSRPAKDSWTDPFPTGVGYMNGWKMTHCQHDYYREPRKIRQCLKGKRVFIHGDSTVRQYLETLVEMINSTDARIKRQPYNGVTRLYNSKKYNIEASWRMHELPYHCKFDVCLEKSVAYGLLNVAKDVTNNITLGSDVIFLITYNAHIQPYHPDLFRNRIKSILKPIKLLKRNKPNAKVFIKSPHPSVLDNKWFDVRIALIYRAILIEELYPVRNYVIYLDTFSIAEAYMNYSLHPIGATLTGQMDQFLAYVC